jgi:predicted ArsR family transcriptional regulator
LAVLEGVKRSGKGMSVQELATALDMSYMGVKSHCMALEAAGHLTTWREPSSKGRPRLLYRLADSGERLFADGGNDLAIDLLRESAALFGATAPQKLLLKYFRSLQASYSQKINVEAPVEWPRSLARLRDREGRMSTFHDGAAWEIRESHNPLALLMKEYPEAQMLEEHMIGEVLGVEVKRREEEGRVIFSLRD